MKEAVLGRGDRVPRGITVIFHTIIVTVSLLLGHTNPAPFTATRTVWAPFTATRIVWEL